jgi:glycosyltransferase involved in cell wall biosynthesis
MQQSSATSALLLDTSRLAGRFVKGRRVTGIDRVCIAYQDRYRRAARAVVGWGGRQHVVATAASQRLFDFLNPTAPRARRDAGQGLPGRLSRATSLAGLLAPSICTPDAKHHSTPDGRPQLLLNVGHTGLNHPGYARWLATRVATPVFMIHDLIPITHPEFARPDEGARHRVRMRTMLETAGGLILNSRSTHDSLIQYAFDEKLRMPACVVSPLGVDLRSLSAKSPDSDSHRDEELPFEASGSQPYFVMLGTIEARKNHWFILQLWRRLVEQLGDAAPRLLIIGQRGWEAESAIDMLDRCEMLRNVVFEISSCSDARLAYWLRGSSGLLFPSFVEGFGLPLAEALSMGTPVIASDLAVFRETVAATDGGVTFIDPLDGPGWMRAIQAQATLTPIQLAAQRSQIEEAFSAPSWEQHFRLVEDFLGHLGSTNERCAA